MASKVIYIKIYKKIYEEIYKEMYKEIYKKNRHIFSYHKDLLYEKINFVGSLDS